MKHYLAIDLGASSGRAIVGYVSRGKIVLEEIHRFNNGMIDSPDGLLWDYDYLFDQIKTGIKKAFSLYKIESISIDTWGVDYVLMNNNQIIGPYYAYRNTRTENIIDEVHNIIPFKDLYKKTGIQFASFNTIYQLYDDYKKGRLEKATDMLMVPQYFSYLLTGKKSYEYTECSTTGLLNCFSKEFDEEILAKLHLNFLKGKQISEPGTILGDLKEELQRELGGNAKVILCASHDTASAFESIDTPEDALLLSSGTWSLLGAKLKDPDTSDKSFESNYTNEGGVGYIRYLKNIPGMWIPNSIFRKKNISLARFDTFLYSASYLETFDVNDPSLVAPKDMEKAVLKLLNNNPPKTDVSLLVSIYNSLALCYKNNIEIIQNNLGRKFKELYIIGGGAKNAYLNDKVKELVNIKVIPMPIEATSIGNIKIQIKSNN